jgi:hypothetical protein
MNQPKFGNVLRYFKNQLKSILYLILLMNIKLLFEIIKDFFDSIYSQYIEEDINEKFINKEVIDEEKI